MIVLLLSASFLILILLAVDRILYLIDRWYHWTQREDEK